MRAVATTAAAAFAHAALLVLLPRAAPPPVEPPRPVEEIAIELTPAEVDALTTAVASNAVTATTTTTNERLSHVGTTVKLPGEIGSAGSVEPAPSSSQQSGGAVPFGGLVVVPSGDRSAIGLAGADSYRNQTALAGATNDGNPTAKQRFDQALNAPLLAHDAEMGMLQEGPAIVALEDATRASAGPLVGTAIFALTFDASGTVTGASVESSSSDRSTWEDIARKAVAALAQKHVRVPAGARGLALHIAVESKVVLPSGAKSPISGVGLKGGSTSNVGLGGNFDVSDIGSKPSRVVGARTIGSSTL